MTLKKFKLCIRVAIGGPILLVAYGFYMLAAIIATVGISGYFKNLKELHEGFRRLVGV